MIWYQIILMIWEPTGIKWKHSEFTMAPPSVCLPRSVCGIISLETGLQILVGIAIVLRLVINVTSSSTLTSSPVASSPSPSLSTWTWPIMLSGWQALFAVVFTDPTYTWPCQLGAYTWQVTISHMHLHRFSQNSAHLFLVLPIGVFTGHATTITIRMIMVSNIIDLSCNLSYTCVWFCPVILLSVKATSPCWSPFFDSPRRENTPLTFLIRGWVRNKSAYIAIKLSITKDRYAR